MKSFAPFALCGLLSVVLGQDINFDAVDKIVIVPISTNPTVTATTVIYNPASAASSVAAGVTASPIANARRSVFNKRDGDCSVQPLGAGPVPGNDTAAAFAAYSAFASSASAAPVPTGYTNTFTNLNASNNAYGYMGYTNLDTYDSNLCASKCSAIVGCMAVNLYFERDPTVDPGAGCDNPSSTTNIKCVFWGGPVTSSNANNYGQMRSNFTVVVAGSNGYVNDTIVPIEGYTGPEDLGDAAINAPLDCNGTYDTYMTMKIFTGVPFDANLCATACSSQSAYNLAHPPALPALPKTCQFFNTYISLKNGVSVGQYCALYTRAWDPSYATNHGQYRGNDSYTIQNSFAYYNTTVFGQTCSASNSTLNITSSASSMVSTSTISTSISLSTMLVSTTSSSAIESSSSSSASSSTVLAAISSSSSASSTSTSTSVSSTSSLLSSTSSSSSSGITSTSSGSTSSTPPWTTVSPTSSLSSSSTSSSSSKPIITTSTASSTLATSTTTRASSTVTSCTCAASATALPTRSVKKGLNCGVKGSNVLTPALAVFNGRTVPTKEICAWKCLSNSNGACKSFAWNENSNSCIHYVQPAIQCSSWVVELLVGDYSMWDEDCFAYDCSSGSCKDYVQVPGKKLPFLAICSTDDQCACGRCLNFGQKLGVCI